MRSKNPRPPIGALLWVSLATLSGCLPESRVRGGSLGGSREPNHAPLLGSYEKKGNPYFLVFGDADGDRMRAIFGRMKELKNQDGAPLFLATTGDNNYGDLDELISGMRKKLGRSIPLFPSLGNHDSATEQRRSLELPTNGPNPEIVYSFRKENILGIVLNANASSDPKQKEFLRQELRKANPEDYKVVFFHQPSATCPTEHGVNEEARKNWNPLFEQYGVHVVFMGHNHNYQRFKPRGPKGTTYLVTGGGGRSGYSVKKCKNAVLVKEIYHFMRVSVLPEELKIEAMTPLGRVIDSFKVSRVPVTPSPVTLDIRIADTDGSEARSYRSWIGRVTESDEEKQFTLQPEEELYPVEDTKPRVLRIADHTRFHGKSRGAPKTGDQVYVEEIGGVVVTLRSNGAVSLDLH